MARQIVKQPNGLYACWSTIIDDFIAKDLSKEQYIRMRADEAYASKKEEMEEMFDKIEKQPNYELRYSKDYEECLEILKSKLEEI